MWWSSWTWCFFVSHFLAGAAYLFSRQTGGWHLWVSIWGKAVTVYKKDLGMSHSFSKYHELGMVTCHLDFDCEPVEAWVGHNFALQPIHKLSQTVILRSFVWTKAKSCTWQVCQRIPLSVARHCWLLTELQRCGAWPSLSGMGNALTNCRNNQASTRFRKRFIPTCSL